jgi:hypothetical protein
LLPDLLHQLLHNVHQPLHQRRSRFLRNVRYLNSFSHGITVPPRPTSCLPPCPALLRRHIIIGVRTNKECPDGFGTGQDFLGFSDAGKRAYAMGAINGFLMAPMLGTPEAQVSRVGRCLENMTDVQVAAIIDKWLREHPERWHYGLHIESWVSVKSACGIK